MDRWRIRELRDPEEKREAAQTVLTALPEWFGLPDSTAAYIRDCGSRYGRQRRRGLWPGSSP